MLKQKEYNVADTNLALFGSDIEKKIKTAAAESEDAWQGAGKEPLQVWRIEKFNVRKLTKCDIGKFYSGDSYIVLKTYKKGNKDCYDVHFWLGKYTTQDEAGTAAYKTVELDDLLGGVPIQHREVQDHESNLFQSYFKDPPIQILEGGIDSGFTHVEEKEYKPRLLWIKGKVNNVVVREVPLKTASMNSGDIFILDQGLTITQWNGKKSGAAEKGKAAQLTRAIDDERGGKPTTVVIEEGDDDCAKFYEALEGAAGDIKSKDDVPADDEISVSCVLNKLSDESGEFKFTEVAKGDIKRDMFDSKDVFIFDCGPEVFAWVGKDSSTGEKKKALFYAGEYLQKSGKPAWVPITRIFEGGENEVFNSYLA